MIQDHVEQLMFIYPVKKLFERLSSKGQWRIKNDSSFSRLYSMVLCYYFVNIIPCF